MNTSDTMAEMLPALVCALVYLDIGEHMMTWDRCVEIWERTYKPALQEEHFGDCTNQPQACIRCQAEDCMRLSGLVEEGILHEHKWIDALNEVIIEGEICRECGAIR